MTEETKLTTAVKLRRLLNDSTIKRILQGDKAAQNQFLVAIYNAIYLPQEKGTIQQLEGVEIVQIKKSSSTLSIGPALNYSPDEIRQLDKATVKWLKQIGVLSQVGIPDAIVINEIEKIVRNGVLLC